MDPYNMEIKEFIQMDSWKNCAFHPSLPIVNFCRSPQCLLPMCPKCVKIHSAEHAKTGTHGQFDSLHDLVEEVTHEVEKTLSSLVQIGETLRDRSLKQHQDKQMLLSRMKQMKGIILESIERYIDQLEREIEAAVQLVEKRMDEEVRNIDEEIEKLSSIAEREITTISGQNAIKGLISHLGSNMPLFYSHKVSHIQASLQPLSSSLFIKYQPFTPSSLQSLLTEIGRNYWATFKGILETQQTVQDVKLGSTAWDTRDSSLLPTARRIQVD